MGKKEQKVEVPQAVLDPENLLHKVGVDQDTVIADFGCGPGIFSVPAARLTKESVYCLDILPSALEALDSKMRTHNLNNIILKRANIEAANGSGLDQGSIDLVIMRRILLQNTGKSELFTEAARVMRSGAKLLIVGMVPGAAVGGLYEDSLTQAEVSKFALAAGLTGEELLEEDAEHYVLVYKKK